MEMTYKFDTGAIRKRLNMSMPAMLLRLNGTPISAPTLNQVLPATLRSVVSVGKKAPILTRGSGMSFVWDAAGCAMDNAVAAARTKKAACRRRMFDTPNLQ